MDTVQGVPSLVHYRHNRVPSEIFLYTVTLRNRRATFLIQYINQYCSALRYALRLRPFSIDAMVVLQDHIHAIWTLPSGMWTMPIVGGR